MLGVLACLLCWPLGVSPTPVLLCCALVLSLELVNTALEALSDLISPEWHPLAKLAKDAAAGAVLVGSVVSVVVGAAVFGPPLYRLLLAPRRRRAGWVVTSRLTTPLGGVLHCAADGRASPCWSRPALALTVKYSNQHARWSLPPC